MIMIFCPASASVITDNSRRPTIPQISGANRSVPVLCMRPNLSGSASTKRRNWLGTNVSETKEARLGAQLEVEHLRCDCIRQSGNEQAPPIFSLRYWISRSRCTYATAARRSLNNTKRTSDGIAADRGSIIRRTDRRARFASLHAESAEFVRLTTLCPGVHICDYTLSTDGDGSMP